MIAIKKEYKIITYNLGHGVYNENYYVKQNQRNALIKNIFKSNPKIVKENIFNQINLLKEIDADMILLQESGNLFIPYFINQQKTISKALKKYQSKYIANSHFFNIGVGNQFLTKEPGLFIKDYTKYHLKNKFSDFFIGNHNFIIYKNEKEKLIIFNIHLIAFKENEEMRLNQFKDILKLADTYYKQGYYVIVGGDWNFNLNKQKEIIDNNNFNLAFPNEFTIRSLKEKYNKHSIMNTYDGFICSSNLEIREIKSLNNYKWSDHSPVLLVITKKLFKE